MVLVLVFFLPKNLIPSIIKITIRAIKNRVVEVLFITEKVLVVLTVISVKFG